MIENKADLREYLEAEKKIYLPTRKKHIEGFMLGSKNYHIWKYLRILRISEYHLNSSGAYHKLMYAVNRRRKYRLGYKLGGFEICENTFGKGLTVYHYGPVITAAGVRIGENFVTAGNICIGFKGNAEDKDRRGPQIGDNVYMGWGATVIGDVRVADNAVIGAGAVVTKNIDEEGAVAAGVPAVVIRARGTENV